MNGKLLEWQYIHRMRKKACGLKVIKIIKRMNLWSRNKYVPVTGLSDAKCMI